MKKKMIELSAASKARFVRDFSGFHYPAETNFFMLSIENLELFFKTISYILCNICLLGWHCWIKSDKKSRSCRTLSNTTRRISWREKMRSLRKRKALSNCAVPPGMAFWPIWYIQGDFISNFLFVERWRIFVLYWIIACSNCPPSVARSPPTSKV